MNGKPVTDLSGNSLYISEPQSDTTRVPPSAQSWIVVGAGAPGIVPAARPANGS